MPKATGSQIGLKWCEFVQHPAEACGPGDPDRGAERQRSADADEQRVLRGVSLEVRSRPEKSPEAHRSRIGSPEQSPELLVGMTTAPDPEHRVTRSRDDSDEPELLVAGQAPPEIEADGGDDQECRAVEKTTRSRVDQLSISPRRSRHMR